DHAPNDGILGVDGSRAFGAEDVIVEGGRSFIGNRRGSAGGLPATLDEAKAAAGQMLDRLRAKLQHRSGRRLDVAMDAHRFGAAHRDPEEFPAAIVLEPVAM